MRRCWHRATGFHPAVTGGGEGPQRAEYKRLIGGCEMLVCRAHARQHRPAPVHPGGPTALVALLPQGPGSRTPIAYCRLDASPSGMVDLADPLLPSASKPHFTAFGRAAAGRFCAAAQPPELAAAGPGQLHAPWRRWLRGADSD